MAEMLSLVNRLQSSSTSPKEVMFSAVSVRPSVSRIPRRVSKRFSWDLVGFMDYCYEKILSISGLILFIMAEWQQFWISVIIRCI